jgi:hypothetical protein
MKQPKAGLDVSDLFARDLNGQLYGRANGQSGL